MKTIPQPKPHPLLGNVPELTPTAVIGSMMRLAREYGPIYRLQFPAQMSVVVSSQELVNEFCNEKRFDKKLLAALKNMRAIAGDGLFTADTHEPNWLKAHRILMPAFGGASIRNMFMGMYDIAEQMMLKWERFGANHIIDVVDDMTRLTLDTIALCAFDYRFNSFYDKELHPFVGAMIRSLKESGARVRRLPIQTRLIAFFDPTYAEDNAYMHKIADEVIAERKNYKGAHKKDLLELMLSARDPQTNEGLDDVNIRYQLVTFLIAGHETTSGLLSFTLYELLKNPECMQKAREEVERVIGADTPRIEHIAKLTYIDQILKESLRLWTPAPAFGLYSREPETEVCGYRIKDSETIIVLLPMLHRDPKVWGDNAEVFNPDRFGRARYEALPPNAWKPFGNGQRSCIGRLFAMNEATLVLAMILQRFELSAVDPQYKLQIQEALTMKPTGFFIRAKRR